jgi:YesN/AraC family two-component response regulator
LSLNSVADHFGISPNYLSSFFKLTTEKNFSDFIVEAKLEKASKLLLEQKRINVAAIANELGYSNHSYFDKLFKERFGLSPIQYRKSKQTDD